MTRTLRPIAMLAALIAVAASPATGQDGEARYTMLFQGAPMQEALTEVAAAAEIDVAFTSEVVAGRRAWCRAVDLNATQLLRCVLGDSGLDYVVLSSGTYVIQEAVRIEAVYGVVTGAVRDAESGRPLPGAHVVLAPSGSGTVTNADGRFAFDHVMAGPHHLSATYVGYRDAASTLAVSPGSPAQVNVTMTPETILALPVVVNGMRRRMPFEQSFESIAPRPESNLDVVRDQGALAGIRAGDVLADLHVQGGDAGEHQFRLDGATVFVPVKLGGLVGPFSPLALREIVVEKAGFTAKGGSHLSGILSASHELGRERRQTELLVDPLAASGRISGRRVRGDREVRWLLAGRRSLGDRARPEAFMNQVREWAELDPFLFDVPFNRLTSIDGQGDPIEELSSSKGLSGTDPETSVFDDDPEDDELDFLEEAETLNIAYGDVHAAASFHFGPLRTLSLSGYRGRSRINREIFFDDPTGFLGLDDEKLADLTTRDGYDWQNRAIQARYEWVAGARSFIALQGWHSDYRLDHPFGYTFGATTDPEAELIEELLSGEGEEDRNSVGETGLSGTWDYALGARHSLTAASEVRTSRSDFRVTMPLFADGFGLQDIEVLTRRVWRLALMLNDRVELGKDAVLELGGRLTSYDGRTNPYFEPRLSLRKDWRLRGQQQLAIRMATGLYRQFTQQVDVGTYQVDALVPSYRVWLPIPGSYAPPRAAHYTAELLWVAGPRWTLTAEAYRKISSHTLVIDHVGLIQEEGKADDDGAGFLTGAQGRTTGLGLTLSRQIGAARLDARYDLERATRQVPDRFGDRFIQVPWGAPHRFYGAADVPVTSAVSISGRFRLIRGRTWGYNQGYYDFLGVHRDLRHVGSLNFDAPDEHGLPAIVQVDAGVRYRRSVGGVKVQAQVSVLNLLNRLNVSRWSLDLDDLLEQGLDAGDLGAGADPEEMDRFERTMHPRMALGSLKLMW